MQKFLSHLFLCFLYKTLSCRIYLDRSQVEKQEKRKILVDIMFRQHAISCQRFPRKTQNISRQQHSQVVIIMCLDRQLLSLHFPKKKLFFVLNPNSATNLGYKPLKKIFTSDKQNDLHIFKGLYERNGFLLFVLIVLLFHERTWLLNQLNDLGIPSSSDIGRFLKSPIVKLNPH